MVRTVSNRLDAGLKAKVAGVALFGSTLNLQYGGRIPNFPKDKAKTWCNVTDGVCGGQLLVNAGHLSYSNLQINEAATWLAGRAKRNA
jgi:cutinase